MTTSAIEKSTVQTKEARRQLHLRKETPVVSGDRVVLAATLTSDDGMNERIWFGVSDELMPMVTESMDPFLVAAIFLAMRQPSDLHVHGQISPSLLKNLNEFQDAWQRWLTKKYTRANITADLEKELDLPRTERRAIAAFSGGLDSSYTVWRHTSGAAGRSTQNLEAGLMVHGFDIPLDQEMQFERAAAVARRTLDDVGVRLLTMQSSLFTNDDWNETHGSAIAACLMLLHGHFSDGLIANTFDYRNLRLPWASNPITDPLLSSDSFQVWHDGTATARLQKHTLMMQWPLAYNNLRICYSAPDKDKNCCRCGKCIMTLLTLRVLGLPKPESFPEDVTNERILALTFLDAPFAEIFGNLVKNWGPQWSHAEWFPAFKRCARYNARRVFLEKPVSNPVLKVIRKIQRHILWRLGA